LGKAKQDISQIAISTPSQQLAFSLIALLYSGPTAPVAGFVAPLAIAELPLLFFTTALFIISIDKKSDIQRKPLMKNFFDSSLSPSSSTYSLPTSIQTFLNHVCAILEITTLVRVSSSELFLSKDFGGLTFVWAIMRLVIVAQYVISRLKSAELWKSVDKLNEKLSTLTKNDENGNTGMKKNKKKRVVNGK